MRTAIHPSRCTPLCASRYGATAKTSPPIAAAPGGRSSIRSQPYVSSPAATIVVRRSRFQATTGPKAASSGQKASPKGQPESTTCGSTSGWKLYGSSQGAAPRSSWWPTSQKRYVAWRWSPAAASP